MSFPDSEVISRIEDRDPQEDFDPQEEYWASEEESERRMDAQREEGKCPR